MSPMRREKTAPVPVTSYSHSGPTTFFADHLCAGKLTFPRHSQRSLRKPHTHTGRGKAEALFSGLFHQCSRGCREGYDLHIICS